MGTILFLLGIGALLLLLEIFLTPGFIVGLIGFACWFAAIYFVYQSYGNTWGNISAFGLSVISIGSIYMGMKSKIWKRFSVNEELQAKSGNNVGFNAKIGLRGITNSAIRPSGTAIFNNEIVEVVSREEWIDAGQEIEISHYIDNKIYVKKYNNETNNL